MMTHVTETAAAPSELAVKHFPFEAQAPQPTPEVHGGAHALPDA